MSFVKVQEGGPTGEQDANGWKWKKVKQYPGADDSVDPGDGQQETQRGDDRDGEKGHEKTPFVGKTLKGKRKSPGRYRAGIANVPL